MFELLFKILTVHLLGDFVFQTNCMVRGIQSDKLRSPYLYLHVFIHYVLLLLCTQFEKKYLLACLLLAFSHLMIDVFTKIVLSRRVTSIWVFVIDQSLHLLCILGFVRMFFVFSFPQIEDAKVYLLVLGLLSVTFASSVLIKKLMSVFDFTLPKDGLKDAGKYIGMLERLLVFVFVIHSFWEGIGFLLAAKSIFRFGDLRENREIKLTEYILIGTFLSFGMAILVGVLYLKCQYVM